MPGLLHEGGLTVAISKGGIFNDPALQVDRVVDTSYQNDSLAQMIVDAWVDGGPGGFQERLLKREADGTGPNAKAALAARGIYLANPVVITEAEYNNGYHMPDPNGVVFVLPNQPRAGMPPPGQSLLETAKLLMACTPNGI
jgi:hypothetical protein